MFKKILNIFSTVFLIFLVAVVIFVFVVRIMGFSPSLFGYHIFRVSSDSMTPTLEVGDIILSKEVPVDEIKKGDIVTYQGKSGTFEGKTITHMVICDPYEKNGEWKLQTRGISEKVTSDDPVISYDQVIGKYVKSLPYINRVYSFFLSPVGLIVFISIIVLLFGYEMISLIISYKSLDQPDDDYYEPKAKKKRKKRR